LVTPVLGTVVAEEHRDGGAGPSAAQQVSLNKRTPRPKLLSKRQRVPLMRLAYRTQARRTPQEAASLGVEAATGSITMFGALSCAGSQSGAGEDRNMQRSMTRIRTSHVGRLPPPKGWEDMPGRLASAEITDPAVIATQVTPAIAETVRRQVETGHWR